MITIDFLNNNKILTLCQREFIRNFNKKLLEFDSFIENLSKNRDYTRENFEQISKYVYDIQTYLNAEIEREKCEGAEQYQGYSLYLKHRRIIFETTFDLENLNQYFFEEEENKN